MESEIEMKDDETKMDWKNKGIKEKYEIICKMDSVFPATKGKYPSFDEFKERCEKGNMGGNSNDWITIGGCRGNDTRSYQFRSRGKIKEEMKKMETETETLKLLPCGNNLYRLSQKIASSEWSRVSKYFEYYHGDSGRSEDCMVEMLNIRGWATRSWNVKKVEEILDIPLEQTIEYRDKEKKKQEEGWAKERAKERAKKKKMFDYIDKQFENAEKPDPEIKQTGFVITELRDYKLIEVEGIDISDPRCSIFYDEVWIIQKKWIWKIESTDWDGYGNNVLMSYMSTRGIGVRVPYTKKLAAMIIGLTSREHTTKKELEKIEEIYGFDFEEIWEG